MTLLAELKRLSPVPLADPIWRSIALIHTSPPRAYHSLTHVHAVAKLWASVRWKEPEETFLAVLFHDAIYVPGRSDNELRSAQLCEALAGPHPRAAQLIRLTARHGRLSRHQVDSEAAKFLDCDMAILGAVPSGFRRYEQQIAREYVPLLGASAYRAGRSAFLTRLLRRRRIFLSEVFHRRFDAQARDNLREALR